MDKFRAMQTFAAIAEQVSRTAASKVLGSSLPAVVRVLAAYEAELGVRLFNRTTRRISLTDEGRRHLERSRLVLAAVQESEAVLSSGSGELAGHLTVTAPVPFGQMYVAPSVTRFAAEHDQVRCTVVLLDRIVNLLEEGMDLGIRIGRLNDSSLVARTLGQIRRVVVAAPAYLRRHGVPKHPRDLTGRHCVRIIGSPPAWGGFQENGKAFRVPVSGNLDFNHVLPAVQACATGAGFGNFFSYQVMPLVAEGRLKIVLEKFEQAPRPISVVYPHARLLPARTRAFIDWIMNDITAFRV